MQIALFGLLVSVTAAAEISTSPGEDQRIDHAVHMFSGPENIPSSIPIHTTTQTTITTPIPLTSNTTQAEEIMSQSNRATNTTRSSKPKLSFGDRLRRISTNIANRIGGIFNRSSNTSISHKGKKVVG
jgi:hypothetical protein